MTVDKQTNSQQDARQRRTAYLALGSFFWALFAAFNLRARQQGDSLHIRPFDLLLLVLATFRLGRLAAFDKVTEPLRRPFTKTVPDQTGVGQTVVPAGSGVRHALGELISCPICAGTWIAAGLVYGLGLAPRITRAFLSIMAAVGGAELLNAAAEAWQWTGVAERKEAGAD
jgi:hypothetical protein